MHVRPILLAAAIHLGAAPLSAGQGTPAALVDADVTVGAGASIADAAGEVIAHISDAFVPHRILEERGAMRRSANVAFRLVKLAFVDAPQENLLFVVNHEVFGHGARVRERFGGPLGYRIGVPWPYGSGGGSTSATLDREPSRHERLAIHAAGMEGSAVAADLLASRALRNGRMTPRDAFRYLAFELDTLSYVSGTNEAGEAPGHDVADFLSLFNELAADHGESGVRLRGLKREALSALANPMLAYAVWGVGRYIATGATDVATPMIAIGGVRYLPLVRYRLAPYGREWSLVNELGGRLKPLQVELRVGRSPQTTPWALAVRQQQIAVSGGWTFGGSFEAWRQPQLDLDTSADEAGSTGTLGAQIRGRVERPLIPVWFTSGRAPLVIDLGIKAAGYVPGEPLRAGLVLRAGVGVPLTR